MTITPSEPRQSAIASTKRPESRDARERDPTADLLLAATRRFAGAERPTAEEQALFREAFYAAIARLDTATRQTIATLLARTPYCPRPIALFLAMDVPAVAMPILRHSTAIGERDLERIIEKTTPIHVRLLAARADLSPRLIERIAGFDDADIHAALVANATLDLDADLRARLRPRPHGPLRRTVVHTPGQAAPEPEAPTVDAGAARLREALGRTRPGSAQTGSMQPGPTQPGRAAPAPSSAPSPMERAAFAEQFEAAAMRRDRTGMVRLMRLRFALAHATAVQALDDRTGDALMVMMKADGFDGSTAHRIVMMAVPAVGLSPEAAERALGLWDRLQEATCRTAFAAWPRGPLPAPLPASRTRHVPQAADAPGVRTTADRPLGERPAAGEAEELRQTG